MNIDIKFKPGETIYYLNEKWINPHKSIFEVKETTCSSVNVVIDEHGPHVRYICSNSRDTFLVECSRKSNDREKALAMCEERNKELLAIPFKHGDKIRLKDNPNEWGIVESVELYAIFLSSWNGKPVKRPYGFTYSDNLELDEQE